MTAASKLQLSSQPGSRGGGGTQGAVGATHLSAPVFPARLLLPADAVQAQPVHDGAANKGGCGGRRLCQNTDSTLLSQQHGRHTEQIACQVTASHRAESYSAKTMQLHR